MSKCKYENKNGTCGLKGCYAYRHKCYTDDMCKCFEPITNADRIRAMSDEELAVFIRRTVNLDGPNYCVNLPECNELLETTDGIPDEKCRACLMNWLRAEAKEEAE